jgi:hypothetical protein
MPRSRYDGSAGCKELLDVMKAGMLKLQTRLGWTVNLDLYGLRGFLSFKTVSEFAVAEVLLHF